MQLFGHNVSAMITTSNSSVKRSGIARFNCQLLPPPHKLERLFPALKSPLQLSIFHR